MNRSSNRPPRAVPHPSCHRSPPAKGGPCVHLPHEARAGEVEMAGRTYAPGGLGASAGFHPFACTVSPPRPPEIERDLRREVKSHGRQRTITFEPDWTASRGSTPSNRPRSAPKLFNGAECMTRCVRAAPHAGGREGMRLCRVPGLHGKPGPCLPKRPRRTGTSTIARGCRCDAPDRVESIRAAVTSRSCCRLRNLPKPVIARGQRRRRRRRRDYSPLRMRSGPSRRSPPASLSIHSLLEARPLCPNSGGTWVVARVPRVGPDR